MGGGLVDASSLFKLLMVAAFLLLSCIDAGMFLAAREDGKKDGYLNRII